MTHLPLQMVGEPMQYVQYPQAAQYAQNVQYVPVYMYAVAYADAAGYQVMYQPQTATAPQFALAPAPPTTEPMEPLMCEPMPMMQATAYPVLRDGTHTPDTEVPSERCGASDPGSPKLKPGQRALKFTRPAPKWELVNGGVTPAERAAMPSDYTPTDVAAFRVFPLRGPKDLADLLVALGFEFDASSPVGIIRARLPRDAQANRCSGYAFVECRNSAVAALLERKLAGVALTATASDGSDASYAIGIGQVKNGPATSTRKLKAEWKSIVAPGCVVSAQREVAYGAVY